MKMMVAATSAAESSAMLLYTEEAASTFPLKRVSENSVPAPTKPGATMVVRTFLSYVSYLIKKQDEVPLGYGTMRCYLRDFMKAWRADFDAQ